MRQTIMKFLPGDGTFGGVTGLYAGSDNEFGTSQAWFQEADGVRLEWHDVVKNESHGATYLPHVRSSGGQDSMQVYVGDGYCF